MYKYTAWLTVPIGSEPGLLSDRRHENLLIIVRADRPDVVPVGPGLFAVLAAPKELAMVHAV
jgi:hypothetical protein